MYQGHLSPRVQGLKTGDVVFLATSHDSHKLTTPPPPTGGTHPPLSEHNQNSSFLVCQVIFMTREKNSLDVNIIVSVVRVCGLFPWGAWGRHGSMHLSPGIVNLSLSCLGSNLTQWKPDPHNLVPNQLGSVPACMTQCGGVDPVGPSSNVRPDNIPRVVNQSCLTFTYQNCSILSILPFYCTNIITVKKSL